MTERVVGGNSRFPEELPDLCDGSRCGMWRTVKCNGDIDVIECAHCGKQKPARCNFDDEYA